MAFALTKTTKIDASFPFGSGLVAESILKGNVFMMLLLFEMLSVALNLSIDRIGQEILTSFDLQKCGTNTRMTSTTNEAAFLLLLLDTFSSSCWSRRAATYTTIPSCVCDAVRCGMAMCIMGSFFRTRITRRGRRHGPSIVYTCKSALPAFGLINCFKENSRRLPSRQPTMTKVSSAIVVVVNSSSLSLSSSSSSIRSKTSCTVVSETFRFDWTRLTHSINTSFSSSSMVGTKVATLLPVL
mmetsp:Transcript_145/g.319  ORF Transcript_145/g.319 Transcript_145/m.319 type:complete len:241 (+) Transcript_145:2154-2876(+)